MPGKISHHDVFHRVRFVQKETLVLQFLVMRLEGKLSQRFNLDPDYQRDHVWTDEQAEQFVGHIIEGGATPLIIVNRSEHFDFTDEVVDGKQRVTACYRWLKGEIAAELTDGRRIFYDDLDEESQGYICGMTGATQEIGYVEMNREQVLRLYLRLNRGGTVHTDAEIDRVRAMLAEEEG